MTTSAKSTVESSKLSLRSFKISEFREKIGAVARPNLFNVSISKSGAPDTFSFRCESTSIPGKSIATIDDIGSGPSLKIPYDVTYNDIDLNIICSQDMKERKFFEDWMDDIVNHQGIMSFYNTYAKGVKLTVEQLDENGFIILSYDLYDVYPISISPMNLSWEETNTYQRFSVTLNYRYHKLNP